ncbi:MAG: hypothetical protein IPJ50_11820 [Betaproteobacteria bacterium]|nr:hypothetical protein [Betaproteobacteria bacterium]
MIKKLLDRLSKKNTAVEGEFMEVDQGQANVQIDSDEKPIVRFGAYTLILGFGGFLLLVCLAPLDEGVPGTGIVSVDTKRKAIQHLRGGLVESISVREGIASRRVMSCCS